LAQCRLGPRVGGASRGGAPEQARAAARLPSPRRLPAAGGRLPPPGFLDPGEGRRQPELGSLRRRAARSRPRGRDRDPRGLSGQRDRGGGARAAGRPDRDRHARAHRAQTSAPRQRRRARGAEGPVPCAHGEDPGVARVASPGSVRASVAALALLGAVSILWFLPFFTRPISALTGDNITHSLPINYMVARAFGPAGWRFWEPTVSFGFP